MTRRVPPPETNDQEAMVALKQQVRGWQDQFDGMSELDNNATLADTILKLNDIIRKLKG